MAKIKEFLTKMSESGKQISTNKKHKKLFISLFATILLVGAVVGIVTGVKSSKKKNNSDNETNEASHAMVKTSCSSTLYPELCFSTLALHPEAAKKVSSQKNMLTAQGRTDPNQNTGIVIQKWRIGATSDLQASNGSFKTFLGRPWTEYSRTVIMQSSITDIIDPVGWHEWSGTFALNTLFYGEYANTGAGAGTSKRVTWKGFKVITSTTEAQAYTPGRFIAGGSWLSSIGFPFALGL